MNNVGKDWKAIAWIAFGLAIFFCLTAAGQYFYTKNEIYTSAQEQLKSDAKDAVQKVLGVTVKGTIVPSLIDKVLFSATNYIVLSSDGLLEEVYSSNKSNRVPGGIISEVAPPPGDFSTPKSYQSPAGDMWTLLIKRMQAGYVVLALSNDSGVSAPGAMLMKNAGYFHLINGAISVDVNKIDNIVNYAIVDKSNTVTFAAGYVPLKTNLPAVTTRVVFLKRKTPMLPLQQDVISPEDRHIGVVIVWVDLSKEHIVLNNELRFFAGLAVLSWLIAFAALLRYWSSSETAKRDLRRAFQNYLSPQVMDAILKDPNRVKLGGQRREVTILFSDIRSFTGLTEMLPPQQLTRLLQEYFDEMTEEVIASEGVVDKFIGDAIMAFWGAPIDQPDQADRAVKTAINMVKRLKVLQAKWAKEGYPVLDIGIGINLGVATVGNFGSQQRFDYTAIGDAVNAASRIEGLNKRFDSHIIISESTLRQLSMKVDTKDLGQVQVRGREERLRVYEVLL